MKKKESNNKRKILRHWVLSDHTRGGKKEWLCMCEKTVDLRSMQETKNTSNNSAAQENNETGLPVPLSAPLDFIFTTRTLICRVYLIVNVQRQCAVMYVPNALF